MSRFIATYWRNQNPDDCTHREIEADIHTMSEVAQQHTPEGYELFEVGQGSYELLDERDEAHDCECGQPLQVTEDYGPRIGWRCETCGLEYMQEKWDAPTRRHADQPKCSCGYHLKYRGTIVRPGKLGSLGTTWDCLECGKRWQIATGTTIPVEVPV